MAIIQHRGAKESCVVDRFEADDIGAPFKVVLHHSVKVELDDAGEIASYTIPDPDGLIRTVVFTRVLHRRKLSGADIKFIRRALGMKQKDLAQRIETTPEHLSRCEAGSLVMSATTEKLLRIYALKTAVKLDKLGPCEASAKLDEALDSLFETIQPMPVHSIDDVLVLHFHHVAMPLTAANDSSRHGGKWKDGDDPPKMVAMAS